MSGKYTNRTALWVRLLLLVPLLLVAVLIYLSGQNSRDGLFESQLFATGNPSILAEHILRPPVHLTDSDFRLIDTIQIYTPASLYGKIDGHDGAFLRFDVVALTFASYGLDGNASVDLYAYRMSRRENALAAFAGERSEDRNNLTMRDAGYESGGGIFFYRGPWYIQITPSEISEQVDAAVGELADSLLAIIPAPEAPIPQLAWFPAKGRIVNSEGFFPNRAFATDFVGEVFLAEYHAGDRRIRAFRHQSDSAGNMFARYAEFLSSAATPAGTLDIGQLEVQRFSAYGEETWITLVEDNLLGLGGVTDPADGVPLMTSLIDSARDANAQGAGR